MKQKSKRLLASLLCLCMALSLLPVPALAATYNTIMQADVVTSGSERTNVSGFSTSDDVKLTFAAEESTDSFTSVGLLAASETNVDNAFIINDANITAAIGAKTATITITGFTDYSDDAFTPAGTGAYRFVIWGQSEIGEDVYTSSDAYTITTGSSEPAERSLESAAFYQGTNKVNSFSADTPLDFRVTFSTALGAGETVSKLALVSTSTGSAYTIGPPAEVTGNGTASMLTGNTTYQIAGLKAVHNGTTPATAVPNGTYYIKIWCTEGTAEKTYTGSDLFTITGGSSVSTPTIHTTSLIGAVTGEAYSVSLFATSGTSGKAVTWELTSGSLPSGLTLSPTGTISGTVTAGAGTYPFSVTATEQDGGTAQVDLSLQVTVPKLTLTWSTATLTTTSTRIGFSADYTVTLKPNADVTPPANTTLTINGLQANLTGKTVTGLPTGVTAAPGNGRLALTFDGSAQVTAADGLCFTIVGVENPKVSINAWVSKMSFTTASDDVYIGAESFDTVAFRNYTQLNVFVSNLDDIGGMSKSLRLYDGATLLSDTFYYNETTRIYLPDAAMGKDLTAKLFGRDSLGTYHELAASASFTATEEDKSISLTADTDVINGYTLSVTPAYLTAALKYDGAAAATLGGYYWFATSGFDASNLTLGSRLILSEADKTQYSDIAGSAAIVTDTTAKTISVTAASLSQSASLSGTVTNSEGNPFVGAGVVVTQKVNGSSISMNTITDKTGAYSVSKLYAGYPVSVTVTADTYKTITAEASASLSAGSNTFNAALTAAGRIIVLLKDGQSVTDAAFSVQSGGNTKKYFSGTSTGSRFILNCGETTMPANTTVTVTMNSSALSAAVSGEVTLDANGYGTLTLAPTYLGVLDWSACVGTDARASGYYVYAFNGDFSYATSIFYAHNLSGRLPEGTYTVYLSTKGYSSKSSLEAFVTAGTAKKLEVTITSNETVYLPSSMHPGYREGGVGTVTGTSEAVYSEQYRVTGVIEAPEDMTKLIVSASSSNSITAMTINGKKVPLPSGSGYTFAIDQASCAAQWTFPMSYTVYCVQKAPTGGSQSVSVSAGLEDGRELQIGMTKAVSSPQLTLNVPAAIASQTVQQTSNGVTAAVEMPDNVPFGGKAPPNNTVRIYDNGVLTAIAISDYAGTYSGVAALASTVPSHIFSAEVGFGGDTRTVTDSLFYSPGTAVLTQLFITDADLHTNVIGKLLPLGGGKISLRMSPESCYTLTACITHSDALEEIGAYTENGDETGYVFFQVRTAGGTRYFKASRQGSTDQWSASDIRLGTNYLKGVTVLFSGMEMDETSIDVTFTDENNQTQSVSGLAVDAVYEQQSITGLATDSELEDYLNTLSAATDDASSLNLMELSLTYDRVAKLLDGTDGVAVTAVSKEQAAARNSTENTRYITYNDVPNFAKSSIPYRLQELSGKGYSASSYEVDGTQYLCYTAVFYYGQNGYPVPSLKSSYVENGFQKSRDDPRLFTSGGDMIGSTLTVTYFICPSTGQWFRTQEAVIPPGAASCIHTVLTQIPGKTEPPTSYTSSELMLMDTSFFGMLFEIRPSDVKPMTYAQAIASVTGNISNVACKANKLQTEVSKDIVWGTTSREVWSSCYGVNNNAKHYFNVTTDNVLTTVKVDTVDVASNAVNYALDRIGNALEGASTVGDICVNFRQQLEEDVGYWGKQQGSDESAEYFKNRAGALMQTLTEVERALDEASIKEEFAKNTTGRLGYLSMAVSFIPGWGTGTAAGMDAMTFLINAAKDSASADAVRKLESFLKEYETYADASEYCKDDEDKDESDDEDQKDDIEIEPVIDPSGIVYEAVLSNPVENATVTLYYAQNGADEGDYIQEGETDQYSDAVQTVHDDSPWLGQSNPLTTGTDGCYAWYVPTGLWYVEATATGYNPGDSNSDTAAVVTANGINWLPVLPPQLEVNIPLVDTTAPTVTEILFRTDGVYLTFSKYMDETNLTDEYFTLTDDDGGGIAFAVEKLDSEQAPVNIDYNGAVEGTGTAPSYTRTVKLSASLPTGTMVTLGVSAVLSSYAGTALADGTLLTDGIAFGSVTAPAKAATPTADTAASEVARNTAVTLTTATPGASIYYVTDDTVPTTGSTLYTAPIIVSGNMTIKAIAVRDGYANSDVLTVSYTVPIVTPPAATPNAGSSSGGSTAATVTVPVSGEENSIQVTATVSGTTAKLNIDADELEKVIGAAVQTGNVVIDLAALDTDIDTAVLEEADWQALAEAAAGSENDMTGLNVRLNDGNLSFDAAALAAAAGGDVTVSLQPVDPDGLSADKKLMAGDRPVFDATVLSGEKAIRDLKGGSVIVSVPYTPAEGEDTANVVIWYLNELGELEPIACSYSDGVLTFGLTHLSEYIIAYFPFTDISTDKWYYGDVAYAYMAGLMTGVADNLFAPTAATSRGMLVTILYRLEGEPVSTAVNPFGDVAEGKWYTNAVIWAAENKIVAGYDTGDFGPQDVLTREQLATILYRYAAFKGYDVTAEADLTAYKDHDKISGYAEDAMNWANANGLVNGYAASLDPKGNAVRAQAAAILERFIKNIAQ